MIHPELHRSPVPLDSRAHRQHAVHRPPQDWSMAAGMNAVFVAGGEFGNVCREYPIVFVRAGREDDGSEAIAPVAVLGLRKGDNLFIDGGRWRARHVPALLALYPFCLATVDADRYAVCVDGGYAGFAVGAGDGAGQRLFDEDGAVTPRLAEVQQQLEALQTHVQRTRVICRRFRALGLLRDMRFDAAQADGRQHVVEGFLTVDENKVAELPAETVYELHRIGALAMMHQHWVSLGTMQRLVEWHFERVDAQAASTAAAPPDAPPAAAGPGA